jgi:membrane protease YdiL (CAAX protease family)
MSPRERWGWMVTAIGLLVILWGVLHLTGAAIGGPIHEFKDRRTYNEVKTAAHRAYPLTLLLGFAGMGIVGLGARLRASGRRASRDT